MNTIDILLAPTQSLTPEAAVVSSKQKDSYQHYISTSSFLRDLYKNKLKDSFESFRDLWLEETKFSSNVFLTTNHPAHLSIIRLGEQFLPFIIEDLQENNNHWFITLNKITGENPIAPEHSGNIEEMKNDWITWAEQNNVI